jgi:predicted extracellular nuclease
VGSVKVLDSTVDPDFATVNRPAIAQEFQPAGSPRKAELQRFWVVVNHLKSKGSSAGGAGDADAGDGQSLSNGTRTRAAQALARWLKSSVFGPKPFAERKIILVGDLNSYLREDPITTLVGAGFPNLIDEFGQGSAEYSYLFQGQVGSLDHALVSSRLLSLVTGYGEWHTNSDEPVVIDYNLNFKTSNQQTLFYAPNEFRSSDHDPLVVGLNPLCGDLNDDGEVDEKDLLIIRMAVGQAGANYDRRLDFDGSGGKQRSGTITLNDWRLWNECAVEWRRGGPNN